MSAASAYRKLILSLAPVSYWRLGETTGTAAADEQSANRGTYTGGVTLGQPGALTASLDNNAAVGLDGSTGFVNIPAAPALNGLSTYTLAAWVNPTDRLARYGALSTFNTLFSVRTDGRLEVAHDHIGSMIGTAAIPTGSYTFALATYDGTTLLIYVNGLLDSTFALAPSRTTAGAGAIGRDSENATSFFKGSLDEVAVFGTVLTAAQILSLYQTASPTPIAQVYDRPRHQVLIGDKDVSERCDSIVYSATDTGGFEICTLGLPSSDRPKKGVPITIRQGLEVAWAGRVAEIADHSQHGLATKTTGGEGLRALLRDTEVSMIYVDRDLTRWASPGVTRQIFLNGLSQQLGSSASASDPPPGNNPSLVQTITDSWVSPNVPLCEAWYDAGPGNLVAQLFYNALAIATGETITGGFQELWFCEDAATPDESYLGAYNQQLDTYTRGTVPRRYVMVRLGDTTTPEGVQGGQLTGYWRNLAVYGSHGLTLRGQNPGGLYPSDVARHALSRCSGVVPGQIVDATGFIAPHVVYRTPTAADVIVDDMAKLMGWPWGVWEPSGVLGTQPRLDFRPPPTDATCVVTKADCDQLDITSRLGDLYNVAEISYTDAAGTAGIATVTLPNPQLNEAGIQTRVLQLDMGLSSLAAATVFGQFALALSQVSARAAGSATLPVSVRLPGGGSKPACLLRPGSDRLRIVDLVDGGPLFDIGTVRRDVFRISRVETTVAADGSLSTVAELDSGANLLETLQARLALSAGVVGSGASGG